MTLAMIVAVAALACLVAAAVSDLHRFEIPDELSIAILALGLVHGFATPDFAWLSHGAALLIWFGIGLAAFHFGWLGGGDVKVMTATAFWVGLQGMLLWLGAVAICGGVLALTLLLLRRSLAAAGIASLPRLFQRDAALPYAVAILAGTLWWALRAFAA